MVERTTDNNGRAIGLYNFGLYNSLKGWKSGSVESLMRTVRYI